MPISCVGKKGEEERRSRRQKRIKAGIAQALYKRMVTADQEGDEAWVAANEKKVSKEVQATAPAQLKAASDGAG